MIDFPDPIAVSAPGLTPGVATAGSSVNAAPLFQLRRPGFGWGGGSFGGKGKPAARQRCGLIGSNQR